MNSNRIALSRKRLLNDPWEDADKRYHEGQLVEGTVTNVVDFGAFIALDNGLEGLLHLSEMGDGALKEPYSYVKKGDRLGLRISHLEPEKRRVGFTQRWGTDAEGGAPAGEGETPVASAETPADEAEPVDAACRRSGQRSASSGRSARRCRSRRHGINHEHRTTATSFKSKPASYEAGFLLG